MKKITLIGLLCFLLFMGLSGCGSTTASNALPTSTTIPTFSFVVPTEAPSVATVAAATSAAQSAGALDPQLVEAGRGRYEVLGCAECHGAQGEGTENGPSLITSTISQADFIGFMRSGGSVGSAHQYSTNRLSDSGGRNLYQYLLSIRQSE